MKITGQATLCREIIRRLKKDIIKMENFRLQSVPEKTCPNNSYEEIKKGFNRYIHKAKILLEDPKNRAKEKSTLLQTTLEVLRVQLALEKVEQKEVFSARIKNIYQILDEIEIH